MFSLIHVRGILRLYVVSARSNCLKTIQSDSNALEKCSWNCQTRAYRSCLGILRLGKAYGDDRLEAACRRALTLGSHSYKSVESILRHRLDQQPLAEQTELALPEDHDNIRGPSYYH